MNKAFDSFLWKDYPDPSTPLGQSLLNRVNGAVDEIDNRVIAHDIEKFDKTDAQSMVQNVVLDEDNGILTVTYKNGSVTTYNSLLGKISLDIDFNPETQKIIVYKKDGTSKEVDLSAFITQYEFVDSETINIQTLSDGKVKAIVKDGSIKEKHLNPNYLGNIQVEVAKAEASKNSAAQSAQDAAESAEEARGYAEQSQEIYENMQQSGTVTGVKGNAESVFRGGNVNITPKNIGSPSNEYIAEHFVPDYVSYHEGIIESKGWYRIAQASGDNYGHSCVVSIKRGYNSPSPEYQKFQVMDSYQSQKIVPIASFTGSDGTHMFTKVRKVWNAVNGASYIEIYQDRNSATNTVSVTVEDAIGRYNNNWKAIASTKTEETVSGVTVLASLDLPANFDPTYLVMKDGSNASGSWGINITGNATTATKSTQDGNGKIISTTYAKRKSEYIGVLSSVGSTLSIGNYDNVYTEFLIIAAGSSKPLEFHTIPIFELEETISKSGGYFNSFTILSYTIGQNGLLKLIVSNFANRSYEFLYSSYGGVDVYIYAR